LFSLSLSLSRSLSTSLSLPLVLWHRHTCAHLTCTHSCASSLPGGTLADFGGLCAQHTPATACTEKADIKLGKERGNTGSTFQGFSLDNATGTVVSSLCKGQQLACLVVDASRLGLGSCTSAAAKGWAALPLA
jgi:hypothetical protein